MAPPGARAPHLEVHYAMGGFLQSLLTDYRSHLERHRNRPFLEAVMAACALAAVADGEVSFSERIRIDQILDTLEELKVFDAHEAVDLFNQYSKGILASPKAGREAAMTAVRTVTGDRERADLLVRICLAVAEAKGEKSLSDQIEIVIFCSLIGVEPRFAGLYTEGTAEDFLGDTSDPGPED